LSAAGPSRQGRDTVTDPAGTIGIHPAPVVSELQTGPAPVVLSRLVTHVQQPHRIVALAYRTIKAATTPGADGLVC